MNNKYYIGQSIDIKRRWTDERCQLNSTEKAWNTHLQSAWKLYGKENFEFKIIEICDADNLDSQEQFWIEFYDSYKNGYNQSLGGGGTRGWKHTDEMRKKFSEIQRQQTTEYKRKQISETSKERWSDPEYRQYMSEVMLDWWSNPENKAKKSGENSWSYGKHGKQGKDNPMYGVCRSGINSTHHTACVQIETDTYYYTMTDAGQQTGVNRAHIGAVCRGERKTAGGFHWRFATEEETKEYLETMGVAV